MLHLYLCMVIMKVECQCNKSSIMISAEQRRLELFAVTVHVETVVLLSHKKPDGHINVKVEFGEGEGKVPLDNIAKRAEEYKPKERVTYKMIKEYIEAKLDKDDTLLGEMKELDGGVYQMSELR